MTITEASSAAERVPDFRVTATLDCLCIIMMIMMFLSILRGRDRTSSSMFFQLALAANVAYVFLDICCWAVDELPQLRGLNMLLNTLFFCGTILTAWLFWRVAMGWIGGSPAKLCGAELLENLLAAVSILLIFGNLAGGYYFTVDAQGHYSRSSTYIFSMISPFLMLLCCGIVIFRQKLPLINRLILLSYPLVPFSGALLSAGKNGPSYSCVQIFVSIFFIYSNFYVQQQNEMVRQQVELSELDAALDRKRSQIMLSQIQPHFLYNALATISHLCRKDAALAKQATDSFADYLRMNLDSLKSDRLIPFDRELEHVRTYLWLEQLRFGEDLQIAYQVGTTDFLIPPLVVQPLVENAVKHGICATENGGTIRISVEAEAGEICIRVADDGAGFDTAAPMDKARSHVGIENVRNRLEQLCGGSLRVESTPGHGTVAEIRIPWEADHEYFTGRR